ncbi:Hydrogenase transcriptional regulatory protein hupR1 [Planctomycetes bacterium Pan216]|uniref:Hydrogenase transcriptional regulatory protein hupR1 n=1 Tax=Kolteria novifilia TaxID=2527975 RepID=A0A518AYX4_9BACT|nr:Hydrogenase transcriptional regulatory protein hupR1 [Planctomycetes bacterium Pan216]
MKRILFVDDEPNILTGLRRALRGYRHEWAMDFAVGGEEALRRLAEQPVDVVVTDMRMPGMDGAQLLKRIAASHPNVVRIMLSGQSDQEGIQQSVIRTHQYFSKPCEPNELYRAIERSCSLRDRLSNPTLQQLISQTSSLPSLPEIYTKLMVELQSPDACVRSVGQLISQDVAMSTKLLQLVNSSFFGTKIRVESASQAAALLGLDVLRPIALSAGIFSQFDSSSSQSFSVESFTDHCVAVGRVSAVIANDVGAPKQVVDDAQMAGLVHDIGKLLMASQLSDEYDSILEEVHSGSGRACEIEAERWGTTHAYVGAHLLGLWGLPQPIVEAVAFHHDPSDSYVEEFTPLTAVHISNAFVNETGLRSPGGEEQQLDLAYIERLGLSDAVARWREEIHEMAGEGMET